MDYMYGYILILCII